MGALMNNTKPRTWRRTLATLTVGFIAGGVAIAATHPASAEDTDQVAALTAQLADAQSEAVALEGDLAAAKAKAHQYKVARDGARTERDNARSQVDTLTDTLDGQYDLNADYAAKIQRLKNREPEVVTKEVPVPDPAVQQKLAEMTEKRDQAVKIADDLAANVEDLQAHGVETWYEDGSYVMYDGTSGCAPTAMCND